MKVAPEPLSRAEQELEDMLSETSEPVMIVFVESYHPGARLMASRLQELMREFRGLRLVQLELTRYRNWAERQRVYGTPSILLFREGKFLHRMIGLVDKEPAREMLLKHLG